MTKIIGFLITKQKRHLDIDFFNVGLKVIELKYGNFYIYLWGFGDIENYKIGNKYSLSFPITDNLLDRNVLIWFENGKIIVENDWLGSIPVFYNPVDFIVSTISNFCVEDKTIHKEGLRNFCEFGYSVFEQTIFQDVKFMRYYSRLIISNDGIKVEYKDDPVLRDDFITKPTNTEAVVALMQEYVSDVEKKVGGVIIIPTSGGYDSRMLNYLIQDKSRIRSFTYGISKNQSKSSEVVYAKKLSEILGTTWEQIELNEYHKYIDKWFSIYGISTHLHGMYHIEFYSKILDKYKFKQASLLSGLIGDAWAQYGKIPSLKSYQQIINLGYTHGLSLDLSYIKVQSDDRQKFNFYQLYSKNLQNEKVRVIFAMRIKLILLSYLTQIPEYFGIPAWTPFLNFDIVKATLNLPDEQRINRIWERNFFRKVGLNIEEMGLKSDKVNRLDYDVAKKAKLEPLDVALLEPYISKQRMIEINKTLEKMTFYESIKNELLYTPKIGGVLRRLGFKNHFLRALYDYYVIKTIGKGLKLKP